MRRLVNNWMYGEVSDILTGRLDSDIYGNSCKSLINMKVHRQGGISRRPPLKKRLEAEGYSRIIPFIVDRTKIYAVLFGAAKLGIYDYTNNTITSYGLPTHTESAHSWATISKAQCKDIRFAQYYNDIYFVHPSFPLMRIRYSSGFVVSLPQVVVNQDARNPRAITLALSLGIAGNEAISFTFNGEVHSLSIVSTSDINNIIKKFIDEVYTGFTAKQVGSTIVFTPDETISKYIQYDLTDTSMFNIVNSQGNTPTTFTYEFGFSNLIDDSGLVYGEDDFPDCYLNRLNNLGVYEFASDIAIIAERMFLTVNGNPCTVYASRPYGTSQVIYPKRSNDTILDFVQFELVSTTNTLMKEEEDLPIKITYDAGGDKLYEGVYTSQKLWFPPVEGSINTKKDLDSWRKGYYVNGLYQANSANELIVINYEETTDDVSIIKKLKKITTSESTSEDYIERRKVYHKTEDEHADTSKLLYNTSTRVYSTAQYYVSNGNGGYTLATASDSGDGGLKHVYTLTTDNYINSKTAYYSSQNNSSYVSNPSLADIHSYYEKTVDFKDGVDIYEYGYEFVKISNSKTLKTKYTSNGMVESILEDGSVIVSAIPYYQFNMEVESNLYEERTEVDKVATASTSIEFQLSSGKNDRISWICLGDYIMIGTENAEWRLKTNINALEMESTKYSSFGSSNGHTANLGTDVIYLQTGNKLRLMYSDYYGYQNVELTLTNPDIMNGTVRELIGISAPEPMIYALKEDGDLVALCSDRTNGVQAFSRWTFSKDKPISLCALENDSSPILVVLMDSDDGEYIAYFDTSETNDFSDCGYGYFLTSDTSIAQGKTYYEKEGNTYSEATPSSNPKSEGLYEYGLVNNLIQYVSRMTANPFDTITQDGSVTIGESKNVSKMIFRCLDTGHIVTYYGTNEKDKTVTRSPVCCDKTNTYIGGLADHAVNVNGGTTRDLMITVESYKNEPMTLLAMAYELRLNKNV